MRTGYPARCLLKLGIDAAEFGDDSSGPQAVTFYNGNSGSAPGAPKSATALWGDLDEKIQAQAVTIPILYLKALRMSGTNVRGGFIHPQYGQPDLNALGLAK